MSAGYLQADVEDDQLEHLAVAPVERQAFEGRGLGCSLSVDGFRHREHLEAVVGVFEHPHVFEGFPELEVSLAELFFAHVLGPREQAVVPVEEAVLRADEVRLEVGDHGLASAGPVDGQVALSLHFYGVHEEAHIDLHLVGRLADHVDGVGQRGGCRGQQQQREHRSGDWAGRPRVDGSAKFPHLSVDSLFFISIYY